MEGRELDGPGLDGPGLDSGAAAAPNPGTAADPEAVGARFIAELGKPFTIADQQLRIGVSIGLVVDDGAAATTADVLLHRVDAAMHAAKKAGKGGLVRYRPGTFAPGLDAALRDDLVAVLAAGGTPAGLEVVYQPIVRFSDLRVVAVEAPVRWTHPVLGPVQAA